MLQSNDLKFYAFESCLFDENAELAESFFLFFIIAFRYHCTFFIIVHFVRVYYLS